jgi:peroxidase
LVNSTQKQIVLGLIDEERARRLDRQSLIMAALLLSIAGEAFMSRFQLKPLPSSSNMATNLYDQNINPTVTNEFATAAFRVGHSLVQGIIE